MMKPVHDGSLVIGEAASWGEVKALLVARGWSASAARDAVLTRGVEGPDGFHLIAAAPVEQMMAEVRTARGGT